MEFTAYDTYVSSTHADACTVILGDVLLPRITTPLRSPMDLDIPLDMQILYPRVLARPTTSRAAPFTFSSPSVGLESATLVQRAVPCRSSDPAVTHAPSDSLLPKLELLMSR